MARNKRRRQKRSRHGGDPISLREFLSGFVSARESAARKYRKDTPEKNELLKQRDFARHLLENVEDVLDFPDRECERIALEITQLVKACIEQDARLPGVGTVLLTGYYVMFTRLLSLQVAQLKAAADARRRAR